MVTREAEWDDVQRDRMLGLGIYEAGICECGIHESLTSDPSNHFTFEQRTCSVCRGVARYGRMMAHSDDLARKTIGENPPPGTPDPADGRRLFVKMLSPLEVDKLRKGRG